jgi:hypothetical protein
VSVGLPVGDDGGLGCDSVARMASGSRDHAMRLVAPAVPDSVARWLRWHPAQGARTAPMDRAESGLSAYVVAVVCGEHGGRGTEASGEVRWGTDDTAGR